MLVLKVSGALLPVGGAIDGSALLHKRSPPNGGLTNLEPTYVDFACVAAPVVR